MPKVPPVPRVEPLIEGWAKPVDSGLQHYFREERSLCSIWRFRGMIIHSRPQITGSEVCERCRALWL